MLAIVTVSLEAKIEIATKSTVHTHAHSIYNRILATLNYILELRMCIAKQTTHSMPKKCVFPSELIFDRFHRKDNDNFLSLVSIHSGWFFYLMKSISERDGK